MKKSFFALMVVALSMILFTSCFKKTDTPENIIEPQHISNPISSPAIKTPEAADIASETLSDKILDELPQPTVSPVKTSSTLTAEYYNQSDGIPPYGYLESDIEVFGVSVGMEFDESKKILQQKYGNPTITKHNPNFSSSNGKTYSNTSLYYNFAEFHSRLDEVLGRIIITNIDQQIIRGIKIGDNFNSVVAKFPNNEVIIDGFTFIYAMKDDVKNYYGQIIPDVRIELSWSYENSAKSREMHRLILNFKESKLAEVEILIDYI